MGNILLPSKYDSLFNFNGEIEYVEKKYGKKHLGVLKKEKYKQLIGIILNRLKRTEKKIAHK